MTINKSDKQEKLHENNLADTDAIKQTNLVQLKILMNVITLPKTLPPLHWKPLDRDNKV